MIYTKYNLLIDTIGPQLTPVRFQLKTANNKHNNFTFLFSTNNIFRTQQTDAANK